MRPDRMRTCPVCHLGHYYSVLRGREMSVANSLIEAQPARVSCAPTETLYQFNESPLLARQSRQESNARSYPRRIPLALKRAQGILCRGR